MLSNDSNFIYPTFKKDDVTEMLHGHNITDSYRWLEDPDNEDTKNFVEKQNNITMPYLNNCKYKEKIKEKLTMLWDFPTYGCLKKHGNYYYYHYNSGLQNQSVLYRMTDLHGTPEVVIDPNQWSEDGTISLTLASFSEDGLMLAIGQSCSGHDWVVVKFMDLTTLTMLPDELERIKFSSVAWTHDNKGVFYSSYLEQEGRTDGTETTSNLDHKLRYHLLGTSQTADVLCWEELEHPRWLLSAEVTDCGRFVLLYMHEGCEPNVIIWICDLSLQGYEVTGRLAFRPLVPTFRAKYDFVGNEGNRLVFTTDDDAPMYRVVEVDVTDMTELHWKELIGTQNDVLLNWAACANDDKLIVCYQKHVADSVSIHCMKTGRKIKDIDFPLGTIGGFFSKKSQSMIFLKFISFLEPGINYIYDLSVPDAKLEVTQRATVAGIDLDSLILKQVFYESKDGTLVPMFLMHRKDLVLDSTSACLLYGYGGFDISIKPSFSVSCLLEVQHLGLVYAVANIRGGGEYGKRWHDSGRLANKQNCFDDFIAAAEYLINQKYTTSPRLAIEGGSNGGLLVAACMNQRPDLFGAVVGHVGVLDMLRFHKFTIGHAWVSDYGDPDQPEHFQWLLRYSPLHNVRPGTPYPACLLLTADHDDRVVPLHTMKFVARLQEVAGGQSTQPLMVRVDVKSGHGSGKPTGKRILEACDIMCFLQQVLRLEWID